MSSSNFYCIWSLEEKLFLNKVEQFSFGQASKVQLLIQQQSWKCTYFATLATEPINIHDKRETLVFISYRHSASKPVARFISKQLRSYGLNVFIDEEDILSGEDIKDRILDSINKCDIFITIVSEGTIDRSHEPGDWWCKELCRALELHKLIIPIQVDGVKLPEKASLPEDIHELMNKKFFPLSSNCTEEDIKELVANIESLLIKHKA